MTVNTQLILREDHKKAVYLLPPDVVEEFDQWLEHLHNETQAAIGNGNYPPLWAGTDFTPFRHGVTVSGVDHYIQLGALAAISPISTIENTEHRFPAPADHSEAWFFRQYDSHWYLIPQRLDPEFEAWVEHGEDAPAWTGTDFDLFMAEHPSQYLLQSKPIARFSLS